MDDSQEPDTNNGLPESEGESLQPTPSEGKSLQPTPAEILSNPPSVISRENTLSAEHLDLVPVQTTESYHERSEGILPPPVMLQMYEKIHPGITGELIGFAKREQTAVHESIKGQLGLQESALSIERIRVEEGAGESRRGQLFAFILAVLIIIGGFSAILAGKSTEGIAAIVTAVAGLVAAFTANKLVQYWYARNQPRQPEPDEPEPDEPEPDEPEPDEPENPRPR